VIAVEPDAGRTLGVKTPAQDASDAGEAPDVLLATQDAAQTNVDAPLSDVAVAADSWVCHPLTAAGYCTSATCYEIPDGCGALLDCTQLPVCTATSAACGPQHEVCSGHEVCSQSQSCKLATFCLVTAGFCEQAGCPAGTPCIQGVCGGPDSPVNP
jgi:hypothetical protein